MIELASPADVIGSSISSPPGILIAFSKEDRKMNDGDRKPDHAEKQQNNKSLLICYQYQLQFETSVRYVDLCCQALTLLFHFRLFLCLPRISS